MLPASRSRMADLKLTIWRLLESVRWTDRTPLPSADAGMCARQRSHFRSLRRKKVTKEMATPLSATPALRFGATCGARSGRGLARTRLRLKQSRALIRPALRSSAQTEGRMRDSQKPKAKSQKPKAKAQGHHCVRPLAQRKARAYVAERSKGPSGCCCAPARVAASRSAAASGSGLATV